MKSLLLAVLALPFASPAPAPDPPPPTPHPLAAARPKQKAALDKTGALHDTAFAAKWGADAKKKGDAEPIWLGGGGDGAVTGSWHPHLRTCTFDNPNADELVAAAGRTIAKDANTSWTLRAGRFADGSTADFVPDPALLLEQLAAWDLAIVHRAVGQLDDRPVETVTVTLNADQVAQALYAGLIPPALTGQGFGGVFFQAFGGGAGARPAPQAPATTVDLAITFDPATALVHQLRFRGWTRQDGPGAVMRARGGVIAVRAVGGVQVAGGGEPEDEAEDEKEGAEPKEGAPLEYKDGLPVRPRKKTNVVDYTVRLTAHGATKAPALSDEQKKLLRL